MGIQAELGVLGSWRNIVHVMHEISTGVAGVVVAGVGQPGAATSGSDFAADSGVSVTKVAGKLGRYKLTFPAYPKGVRHFHFGFGSILGADDAAFGATAGGAEFIFRVNKMDDNTPDGTILVQAINAAGADAEVPDFAEIYIHLWIAV